MNKIKHLGFYIIRYYRTLKQKARPKAEIGKSGKGRVGVWEAKKGNSNIPPWVKNHKIAPNVSPSFFLRLNTLSRLCKLIRVFQRNKTDLKHIYNLKRIKKEVELLGVEIDKIKVDSLSWNILQKEIEKCQ